LSTSPDNPFFSSLDTNSLSGTIPADFFGPASFIAFMSLQNNLFIGTLPSTLNKDLFSLLDMGGNSLSCPLQDYSTWTTFTSQNDYTPACTVPPTISQSDMASLLSLYNGFTNAGSILPWDVLAATWPCDQYPGVICDSFGNVIKL